MGEAPSISYLISYLILGEGRGGKVRAHAVVVDVTGCTRLDSMFRQVSWLIERRGKQLFGRMDGWMDGWRQGKTWLLKEKRDWPDRAGRVAQGCQLTTRHKGLS